MLLTCIIGCAARHDASPPPAPESDIAPLRESELIELADRVARQVIDYARRADADGPLLLGYPTVSSSTPNVLSPFLAEAIVNAVHDRLGGVARFAEPDAQPTGRPTFIRFHPASADGPAELEFDASDDRAQAEFVHETVAVRSGRGAATAKRGGIPRGPKPSSGPAGGDPLTDEPTIARGDNEQPSDDDLAPPPPDVESGREVSNEPAAWRPIKLNASERALAAWLVEQWPNLKERTLRTRGGNAVVFIDRRTRDMLTVSTQRAATHDGRLRVEVEAKARDHDRRIAVRVIFLDAERRVTETTPALPYHLLTDYATTIAITAATPAEHYVVLLQSVERAAGGGE